MQPTHICTFISRYSEIQGFQKRRAMTYAAERIQDGVRLSVKEESASGTHTEICICPSESFEKAISFLQYISENAIGLGCWQDILHDTGIPYTTER